MNKAGFLAVTAALTLTLSGCSSPSSDSPSDSSASAPSAETSTQAEGADLLSAGDSFDVPCPNGDESSCMNVEILEVSRADQCQEAEVGNGESIVSLKLKASMEESTSEDFTSPFRGFPWKYSTPDKTIASVDNETTCNGDSSYLNLMDEFPGYTAEGSAFFVIPEEADVLHFKVNEDDSVKIDISPSTSEGSEPSTQKESTQAPQENQAPPAQPSPTQNEVTVTATETSPDQPAPVIGFTEAPGAAEPTVMDKVVLRCGTAAEHMEPGTTFFTDGTSGWTAACAAQMQAEYEALGY